MRSSVPGARFVATQAERGQIAAQAHQRLVVEKAAQVVRAVGPHLRLADAAEQRLELVRHRGVAAGPRGAHQLAKRLFKKRTGHRRSVAATCAGSLAIQELATFRYSCASSP